MISAAHVGVVYIHSQKFSRNICYTCKSVKITDYTCRCTCTCTCMCINSHMCVHVQELAVKLDIVMEPSFIALGPFHMAVGINDRAWIYEIREHGNTMYMYMYMYMHVNTTLSHVPERALRCTCTMYHYIICKYRSK